MIRTARADQALRLGSPPSTRSTWTCGPVTSTASSAPTVRARPPRCGCCSAWCWRRRARIEVLGQPMPAAAAEVLPRVGALVEGPAAYGHLSGRANLRLLDASGPAGPRRGPTGAARVAEVLDQVGLGGVGRRPVKAYSLGMRQRLGLAAALLRRTGAAGARRTDQRPGSAGHPRDPGPAAAAQRRRERPSSCPATCWPRWSSSAPGSACSTGAGWCVQDSAGRPAGPDRTDVVRTDPGCRARPAALLDGRVESPRRRPAARCDAGRTRAGLNAARLVGLQGVRVDELGPSSAARLEEVVAAAHRRRDGAPVAERR